MIKIRSYYWIILAALALFESKTLICADQVDADQEVPASKLEIGTTQDDEGCFDLYFKNKKEKAKIARIDGRCLEAVSRLITLAQSTGNALYFPQNLCIINYQNIGQVRCVRTKELLDPKVVDLVMVRERSGFHHIYKLIAKQKTQDVVVAKPAKTGGKVEGDALVVVAKSPEQTSSVLGRFESRCKEKLQGFLRRFNQGTRLTFYMPTESKAVILEKDIDRVIKAAD